MDYVSQTNGAYLRDLRIEHGEKQDELARAIHVSRQLLSMWERDRARATESSLADIAAHYRLNVDTVMDGYFCAPSAEVTAEDAESEADVAQDIEEEIAAAEISAAPRRGVHPIMWTGLITAVAVAVVYAFAAGVLWGIVFPRAADGATVQAIVVVNVPVLAACLAAILICVSALAMIAHWLLRKVLRRNKNQEG